MNSSETVKKVNITAVFLVGVSVVLLLVAVLPLLYLARYSHPCADDYTYGYLVREAWVNTRSFFEVIKQAFSQVKSSYYTWQGTHTSIFFMALTPAVFEESIGYGICAWLMIGMTVVSVSILMHAFFCRVFKAPVWKAVFVSFVTLFWMIEALYAPATGFFWYNGSVHYLFMHGFMLLMISAVIAYLSECNGKSRVGIKVLYLVLTAVFAWLCGGANYSTALVSGCILALLVIAALVFFKRPGILVPLVFYAVSFMINVAAPGNTVRGSYFNGMSPWTAIYMSFLLALMNIGEALDLQTVIVLLLLLPVLYGLSKETKLGRKIWVPIVSLVLSFGLQAALNVPLFYAMGGAGIFRQMNICKLWFQLTLVINVYLILCVINPWIEPGISKIRAKVFCEKPARYVAGAVAWYFVMALLIVVHMKTSDMAVRQYSSYVAYVELKTGEAQNYDREYRDRLMLLDGSGQDVVLKEFENKPYLLYWDDITADSGDWRNIAFAKWYHISSVRRTGE